MAFRSAREARSILNGVDQTGTSRTRLDRGQAACTTGIGTEGLTGQQVPVVSYLAGDDWRLLGTYNAVDAQRVFRFGQALGRRFARVPIPPMQASQFDQLVENEAGDLPDGARHAVKSLYAAHLTSEQALGPALFLEILAYVRVGSVTRRRDRRHWWGWGNQRRPRGLGTRGRDNCPSGSYRDRTSCCRGLPRAPGHLARSPEPADLAGLREKVVINRRFSQKGNGVANDDVASLA